MFVGEQSKLTPMKFPFNTLLGQLAMVWHLVTTKRVSIDENGVITCRNFTDCPSA